MNNVQEVNVFMPFRNFGGNESIELLFKEVRGFYKKQCNSQSTLVIYIVKQGNATFSFNGKFLLCIVCGFPGSKQIILNMRTSSCSSAAYIFRRMHPRWTTSSHKFRQLTFHISHNQNYCNTTSSSLYSSFICCTINYLRTNSFRVIWNK